MKLTKVLVPVAGGGHDEDALMVAGTLARRYKATVVAIYVIEVKRALPIDAEIETEIEKGERVLDQAEQIVRQAEAQIDTEMLQARDVGAAIVDEATGRGVDVIIMGLPQRRRLAEYGVGSTISYVLKNAPCRVWICRGIPDESPG